MPETQDLPLPERLRKLVIGRTEWQIVDPEGGGICMWFDRDNYSNPAREAQEWLDEHKRKYPARFGSHEVKKVHILSELERAALEAAEALEAQASAKLPDTLRRVDAARDFPQNTCPASRHVQLMGEALAAGKPYPMLQEQPRYCAEDLLSVVASLYETRTALAAAAPAHYEPVGGFVEDGGRWGKVSPEHATDPDVVTLYRRAPEGTAPPVLSIAPDTLRRWISDFECGIQRMTQKQRALAETSLMQMRDALAPSNCAAQQ